MYGDALENYDDDKTERTDKKYWNGSIRKKRTKKRTDEKWDGDGMYKEGQTRIRGIGLTRICGIGLTD